MVCFSMSITFWRVSSKNLIAIGVAEVGALLLDVLRTKVRRHDDDGVFEVHRTALVVG